MMTNPNRRTFIKKSTALAALSATGLSGHGESSTAKTPIDWPVTEGEDTPKLTLNCPFNANRQRMRMIKQIGADHVLMSGPRIPWVEKDLRAAVDRFQEEGLSIINMMISGFPNVIRGSEGRDAEIEQVQASLRAAGAIGLPVVEYNFYAHRLTEGYYHVEGRGGAGYLGYDYHRQNEEGVAPKDLGPLPGAGSYTREELWENLTYFLKAVIPVAEEAGVRMALHPNDPPAAVSRGSEQIMATFADWKRLIDTVDSVSNGMTYDCGVSHEIGENPLEVLDYLSSRDRINHVHYRNCIVEIPAEKYVEVFNDEGNVNMFEVMRELVKRKYRLGLFPEHPRKLDFDAAHPGGGDHAGYIYNMAYTRGMLQAVLSL